MKHHPLFTMDRDPAIPDEEADAKDALDIGSFHVYKVLPGRGPVVWGGMIEALALQSLDQFIQRYGGGHWELRARGADGKGIVRIVRFETAGPEKDWEGKLVNPPPGIGFPQQQQAAMPPGLDILLSRLATPPPAQESGGTAALLIAALTALAPVVTAMVQAREESQRANLAMMTSMGQNQQNGIVQLIQALTQRNDPSNTAIAQQESFMHGLETMGKLLNGMKDGKEGPDALQTISTVVENLKTLISRGADTIKFVNNGGVDVDPVAEGPHTSA